MGCLVVTRNVIALICLSESRLFYPLKRYQRYHEPYCGSWRSLLFRGSRWVSPLPFLDHGSAAKNFNSTDTIGLCGRESSWRYSKTNSGSSLTSFFFFFFDFFSYGSPSAQLDTDTMIGGGKTRRQLLAQYHLSRKNFHAFRLFFNLRKSSRFPIGVPNSLPHVNAELIKIKHNWQYCKLIDL